MKPKPITRNAAIRHANENVSQFYRFKDQWCFNRWDTKAETWIASSHPTWAAASEARKQTLINEACRFLGVYQPDYYGGNWTSYVPKPSPSKP